MIASSNNAPKNHYDPKFFYPKRLIKSKANSQTGTTDTVPQVAQDQSTIVQSFATPISLVQQQQQLYNYQQSIPQSYVPPVAPQAFGLQMQQYGQLPLISQVQKQPEQYGQFQIQQQTHLFPIEPPLKLQAPPIGYPQLQPTSQPSPEETAQIPSQITNKPSTEYYKYVQTPSSNPVSVTLPTPSTQPTIKLMPHIQTLISDSIPIGQTTVAPQQSATAQAPTAIYQTQPQPQKPEFQQQQQPAVQQQRTSESQAIYLQEQQYNPNNQQYASVLSTNNNALQNLSGGGKPNTLYGLPPLPQYPTQQLQQLPLFPGLIQRL